MSDTQKTEESSNKTMDIESLSHDIDVAVVDVFKTLGLLFSARRQLEDVMKDGYLNMAKARYEMGRSSSVSQLQYCEQDLSSALYHISISETTNNSTSTDSSYVLEQREDLPVLKFLPFTSASKSSQVTATSSSSTIPSADQTLLSNEQNVEDTGAASADIPEKFTENSHSDVDISELGVGVRKRLTISSSTDENKEKSHIKGSKDLSSKDCKNVDHKKSDDDNDDLDGDDGNKAMFASDKSKLLDEELSEGKSSEKEKFAGIGSSGGHKDPLRWFGVLVPRSLRSSQCSFKQAIEISCEVASLQSQLHVKKMKVVQLMKAKQELSKTIDRVESGTKSNTEDTSVTTAA